MNKKQKAVDDRAIASLFGEVFSSDATANPSFILSSPENKDAVDLAVKVLMEIKDELPGVLVVDYTDKEACYEAVSNALMDADTNAAKHEPACHTVVFLPPLGEDEKDLPAPFSEACESLYENDRCMYPQLIVLRDPNPEDTERINDIVIDQCMSLHVMALEHPTEEDIRVFFKNMAAATEGTRYPDL